MYGATEVLLRSSYSAPWVYSWAALLVAAAIVYWFAEVSYAMLLKDSVGDIPPIHRLFITGVADGVASVLGFGLLLAMRMSNLSPRRDEAAKDGCLFPAFTWLQLAALACAGAAGGLGFGLASKSLEYIDLSSRTFVDSTGVLFTQAAALICGLDSVDELRFMVLFLFVLGGAIAACSQTELISITGIVLRFVSLMLTAGEIVLLQLLVRRDWGFGGQRPTALTRIKMLAVMKPVSGIVCLVLSGLWEHTNFTAANHRLVALCLVVGDLTAFAAFCELTVLSNASALTWQVFVTLAMIPTTASEIIFRSERAPAWLWVGFGFWAVGALIYLRMRLLESPPPDDKEGP